MMCLRCLTVEVAELLFLGIIMLHVLSRRLCICIDYLC